MGFLDSVRDAIKGAVTGQSAKKDAAAPAPSTVPAGTGGTEAEPSVEPAVEPAPTEAVEDAREATFTTYTVETGDSLPEIGARFGVPHLEIARINSIENPDLIFPGQVFRIPTS